MTKRKWSRNREKGASLGQRPARICFTPRRTGIGLNQPISGAEGQVIPLRPAEDFTPLVELSEEELEAFWEEMREEFC